MAEKYPLDAGSLPHEKFARRRREDPLGEVEVPSGDRVRLAVRYDDVRMTLSDPRFSTDPRVPDAPRFRKSSSDTSDAIFHKDPPELNRMRRLRGMANPISLGLHFSSLLCVSTFNAVRPDFPGFVWPLFCGLWLLLIGRTLWWSLPDATADRAAGLSPPAVRYGLSRALTLASAASAGALALIAWGLWWGLGPFAAALGTTMCGILLAGKVRMAGKQAVLRSLHESRMRRRTLVLVVSADVLFLALPLLRAARH